MKDLDKMNNSEKAIYYEMLGHRFETASNVLRNQIDRLEELKTRISNKIDTLINDYDNLANANFNEANDYFEIVKNIEAETCEPEITITPAERDFLRNVNKALGLKLSYVARDADGEVYLYGEKPYKKQLINSWGYENMGNNFLNVKKTIFPFITFEDEEPWSFDDLLALPVKERE